MSPLALVIFLLFFPAGLGLVGQILWGNLAQQLLAVPFLLFSIEQARMAVIDLEQIAQAKQSLANQQSSDERIHQFHALTISTIVVELVGFYCAAVWLNWGAIIVLLSQIGFNLFATIQLQPSANIVVRSRPFSERGLVLLADGIGLVLIGLWSADIAPLWISSSLFAMVIAYGGVKYGKFAATGLKG